MGWSDPTGGKGEPAVDCCVSDHWFDGRVGWPGRHDGGLPDDPKTPCVSFQRAYDEGLVP